EKEPSRPLRPAAGQVGQFLPDPHHGLADLHGGRLVLVAAFAGPGRLLLRVVAEHPQAGFVELGPPRERLGGGALAVIVALPLAAAKPTLGEQLRDAFFAARTAEESQVLTSARSASEGLL